MNISKEKLKDWDSVKEHGDVAIIASLIKKHPQNVSIIILSGKGKLNDMVIIDKFFQEKRKIIKQLNKVLIDEDGC